MFEVVVVAHLMGATSFFLPFSGVEFVVELGLHSCRDSSSIAEIICAEIRY